MPKEPFIHLDFHLQFPETDFFSFVIEEIKKQS
jgi:hypothetical protein